MALGSLGDGDMCLFCHHRCGQISPSRWSALNVRVQKRVPFYGARLAGHRETRLCALAIQKGVAVATADR
jgi:hypothetical protein